MALSNEELERYSRQIILKDIGYRGQKKLAEGKVLVAGAGALGAPAAMYLAAAGVGTIGIADADIVSLSNLHRQIIHMTSDIGRPKAVSAGETIRAINPHVQVNLYEDFLTKDNIAGIVQEYDFVIDATDNFPSKYLINDVCVMLGKPYCFAGIVQFFGQIMTIVPKKSPCYRCVFGDIPRYAKPQSCQEAGVAGPLGGMAGSIQAMEAIKYLTGAGELLSGKLMMIDLLNMDIQIVDIAGKDENCPVCSDHPTITELIQYEQISCEIQS